MMLSRFSPLLTYYHTFPNLGDKLQYEWAEVDMHDYLTDFYKHLHSRRSIRSTIAALGAQNIWVKKRRRRSGGAMPDALIGPRPRRSAAGFLYEG